MNHPTARQPITRHDFTLTDAPHGVLRGTVFRPEAGRGVPVVIGLHGFKGFQEWGFWPATGERFAAAGVALVTFNMSGSGVGEDPQAFTELDAFAANTVSRELDDLGRMLEAVTGRDVPLGGADVRRLGLLGHSRGGGVAVLRAARDPRIRSLVTWAAVSRFDRFDEEQVRAWRDRGYAEIVNSRTGQVFRLNTDYLDDLATHGDTYSPVESMRRLETPTLLIHGTRDETVIPDEAEALRKAASPGTVQLDWIQGGDHTFGARHPWQGSTPELDLAWEKSLDWFTESL